MKMWGQGDMVNALPLEESPKLFHCEEGTVVSMQDTRGTILGHNFLELLD